MQQQDVPRARGQLVKCVALVLVVPARIFARTLDLFKQLFALLQTIRYWYHCMRMASERKHPAAVPAKSQKPRPASSNNSSLDPSLALMLEEAANTCEVITSFFMKATCAIREGALPALVEQQQLDETMTSFQTAMHTLTRVLSDSTAWHEAQNNQITSTWTLLLLSRQSLMLDACFAATTAALDNTNNHSNASFDPQNLIILSTTFKVLRCWILFWPSEQLLESQPRLASLNSIVEKAVEIPRQLRSSRLWQTEIQHLIVEVLHFSKNYLRAIVQREGSVKALHGAVTAVPATLLPYLFLLMDEQLHRLLQKSTLACMGDMLGSIQSLLRVLCNAHLPATFILSPALMSFLKHLVAASVTKRLATGVLWSTEVAQIQENALAILIVTPSQMHRSGAAEQPVSTDTASSRIKTRAATVSEFEYICALFLCTAPCNDTKADGNCAHANLLLCLVLHSWRLASGSAVLLLQEWKVKCLPSMILWLTRQGCARVQSLAALRQRQQQRYRQDLRLLFENDNGMVRSLIIDTWQMFAAFTGTLGH